VTEPTGNMQALLEQIAKSLVDEPDQVSVSESAHGESATFELKVAPNDLGKVIGKQGRTARAMRALISAAGVKLNKRFNLEIVE
jgi:uncharacterized protein